MLVSKYTEMELRSAGSSSIHLPSMSMWRMLMSALISLIMSANPVAIFSYVSEALIIATV